MSSERPNPYLRSNDSNSFPESNHITNGISTVSSTTCSASDIQTSALRSATFGRFTSHCQYPPTPQEQSAGKRAKNIRVSVLPFDLKTCGVNQIQDRI